MSEKEMKNLRILGYIGAGVGAGIGILTSRLNGADILETIGFISLFFLFGGLCGIFSYFLYGFTVPSLLEGLGSGGSESKKEIKITDEDGNTTTYIKKD